MRVDRPHVTIGRPTPPTGSRDRVGEFPVARVRSSSFTVANSSFADCDSSFAVCNSSFVLLISSLAEALAAPEFLVGVSSRRTEYSEGRFPAEVARPSNRSVPGVLRAPARSRGRSATSPGTTRGRTGRPRQLESPRPNHPSPVSDTPSIRFLTWPDWPML